jgi:hypothetical protein
MYFSRLEAVVDDAMAAEAAALAREADASDVMTLAAAFERLAAQHAQSPFELTVLVHAAARSAHRSRRDPKSDPRINPK